MFGVFLLSALAGCFVFSFFLLVFSLLRCFRPTQKIVVKIIWKTIQVVIYIYIYIHLHICVL